MKGLRAFLVVAVICAGAFALYTYSRSGGDVPLLTGRCTVGLAGAAVSVSVEGPTADAQCGSMSGQVTDGGNWYLYEADTEPGGAVICQYRHQGNTWTVRDQGIANLYGSGVCRNLRAMAGPTIEPDEPVVPDEPVESFAGCVVVNPGDCSIDGDLSAVSEDCNLGTADSIIQIDASGVEGHCQALKDELAPIGTFVDIEPPTGAEFHVCEGDTATGGVDVWDVEGSPIGLAVCAQLGLAVLNE